MDELAAGGIRAGDQAGIGIVLRTRRCVAMKLVGRLDGGNRSQQLDGGRRASLAQTVVHDGHRRLDAPHQDRIVRDIQTMCVTWYRSMVPRVFWGQTSAFSMFQVRSPQSRKSNSPSRKRTAKPWHYRKGPRQSQAHKQEPTIPAGSRADLSDEIPILVPAIEGFRDLDPDIQKHQPVRPSASTSEVQPLGANTHFVDSVKLPG